MSSLPLNNSTSSMSISDTPVSNNSSRKINSMPPPTTFSPRLSPGIPTRPGPQRRDRSGSGSYRDSGLSPVPHMHSNRSLTSSPNPNSTHIPFLPNITCIPPHYVDTHDPAVEHALEAERTRIREREKEEMDMDIDQLKQAIKRERSHSCRLVAELATLKSVSVKSQAEAEAYEEGRINCLMRRLECLQREKGRIIVELEREEEMLTNSLQKKLNEVRREKALLEQQIEREHSANSDLRSRLGGRQQQSNRQASQEPSCEGGNDTYQK